MISLIVAVSENGVIGAMGRLPWRLSSDLARFSKLTKGHKVIMGRNTFESIVARLGKPLPDRDNIVLSRTMRQSPNVQVFPSFAMLEQKIDLYGEEETFVIGGGEIYKLVLPKAKRVYKTLVHATVNGDTYFPALSPEEWKIVSSELKPKDDKNEYDATYLILERRDNI